MTTQRIVANLHWSFNNSNDRSDNQSTRKHNKDILSLKTEKELKNQPDQKFLTVLIKDASNS